MSNILVFGASGFIGKSLVRYLLNNNLRVIAFINKNKSDLELIQNEKLILIEELNVSFFDKYPIDVVYHLASVLPSNNSCFHEFYKGNVLLTNNILDFVKLIYFKQFVYVSTGSVFSKPINDNLINEDTAPNPKNYYALTKYMSEKILEIELLKIKKQLTIIRFPSIFGKENSTGIINEFYNLAIKNRDIEVYSDGERYRNLLYLDDAIEILYRVYLKKDRLNPFEIFMAGSYNSLKLFDIANFIVNNLESNSQIIKVSKFPPSDFDVFIDLSKIKRVLEYKPSSIEVSLTKHIKDMKNEKI